MKLFYPRAIIATLILLCTSCTKFHNEPAAINSGDESLVQSSKTNVILILADDIGFEVPGCSGGQSYSTPNIDLLAQKGITYNNCYSMPLCSPSRVELLTGKYNFRNYTLWGLLDSSQRTFANIMQQGGYTTCVAGKWQLGGGALSAATFGFDKFSLFEPFYTADEGQENRFRYKSPHIYQDGAYLPDNATKGNYADDMFTQYICDFIDSNKKKPFFVYYPFSLCHQPFSPPPSNPDYANWDPLTRMSNKKYYPFMVSYMDTKIGQILDKLQSAGVASNTLVIFIGDNGTPKEITSQWKGVPIQGGKGKTQVYGIHVPLIVTHLGKSTRAGAVANTLVDFSDFLPTLADIAGVKVTPGYGTIDGVSFYNSILGKQDSIRSSVFFHWEDTAMNDYKRWAQTSTYKLYDVTNSNRFYNFALDPLEQNPIPANQRTAGEKQIVKMLKASLDSLHR